MSADDVRQRVHQQLTTAGFLPPNYQGGTLANIPATAAALLEAPFDGLPPIDTALWSPLAGDVRHVVVLLIDGMGVNLLAREEAAVDRALATPHARGELTSIFPSTTVAALSSLWTGAAPAQHGLVGLNLLLPDLGTMMFVLTFSSRLSANPNELIAAGLSPEAFLRAPGVGEQMVPYGVDVINFNARELLDTPLSRMFSRGVTRQSGSSSWTEQLGQIRAHLERPHHGKTLSIGYWPKVDTLAHYTGWDSAEVAAELADTLTTVQSELFERLSPAARQGTVVLMLADHGQTITPHSHHIYIEAHPELHRMLLMRPAGELRVPYLYVRQGARPDVLDYFAERLPNEFLALPSDDALAAGLFGPSPYAPETAVRLGDIVVLSRGGHVLATELERGLAERFVGMHAGMTPDEMRIPFLGWRLDR
jgi:hypothetical protein